MRFRFEVCLIILLTGWHTARCEAENRLTPEQIEEKLPTEEVTVLFQVKEVGALIGGVSLDGQIPYLLEPDNRFKDRRSKLHVFLVGKAVKHARHLGIDVAYFEGKTITVTGKVRYETYPQITRNGKTVIPEDNYPSYSICVDDLENIKVVPR